MDCSREKVEMGRPVRRLIPSVQVQKDGVWIWWWLWKWQKVLDLEFILKKSWQVCWAHCECTIYICWVNGYTEYSVWGRTFLWSGWSIPVIDTTPLLPLLFPCSFTAVWWLILCSTFPHCREECSWTLNTRILSLENIHNSSKFGFWIICNSLVNFP